MEKYKDLPPFIKCGMLEDYRKMLAEENSIEYYPVSCGKDEIKCSGICPMVIHATLHLHKKIEERRINNKPVIFDKIHWSLYKCINANNVDADSTLDMTDEKYLELMGSERPKRPTEKEVVVNCLIECEKALEEYKKEKVKQPKQKDKSPKFPGNEDVPAHNKEVFLYECQIAGLGYTKGLRAVAPLVKPSTVLALQPDYNNDFDHFAVKVLYKDLQLGFIPKAYNYVTTNLLKADKILIGKVEYAYLDINNPSASIKVYMLEEIIKRKKQKQ